MAASTASAEIATARVTAAALSPASLHSESSSRDDLLRRAMTPTACAGRSTTPVACGQSTFGTRARRRWTAACRAGTTASTRRCRGTPSATTISANSAHFQLRRVAGSRLPRNSTRRGCSRGRWRWRSIAHNVSWLDFGALAGSVRYGGQAIAARGQIDDVDIGVLVSEHAAVDAAVREVENELRDTTLNVPSGTFPFWCGHHSPSFPRLPAAPIVSAPRSRVRFLGGELPRRPTRALSSRRRRATAPIGSSARRG